MTRRMKIFSRISMIAIFLLVSMTNGFCQKPSFTQYFLNLPSINPSFTGFEPFLDVKSAYRQRWNNFTEDNSSFFLGMYGAIGKTSPTSYKNNAPRISNPRLYGKLAEKNSLRRLHGVGGMVMANRIGPFQALTLSLNYAYHLPLTRESSLSMGTKIAYKSYKIDFQELTVRHPNEDQFYQQLINSSEGKQQQIVGDFGITFYNEKFFLGVSSSNLIPQQLGKDELLKIATDPSLELVAGTELSLSPQMELYPGMLITHSKINDTSWEANLRVRYNKLIYLGAAYENKVKAALLFGLTFDSRYNINYSYDYYLNDLKDFDLGNHEFTLGLAIFNKYSQEPRLW